MGSSQMQMRKQAFRISALMAALLGVYGTAHAVGSSVVIETGSEASPYRLDSSIDYTSVHVRLDAHAVGTAVRINQTGAGPDKGNSVYALSAAGANSVISLDGGSIAGTGAEYSRGILASTGATVNTNGTAISTAGYNSHAVYAWASSPGQSLVPKVNVTGGTISTQGHESYGLYSHRTGSINAKSVNITTAGRAGFGAFAEDGGSIGIDGAFITTTGGFLPGTTIGSIGVISKKNSNVSLNRVNVTTSGDYAHGVLSEVSAVLNAEHLKVRTSGTSAYGANAITSGTLDITGFDIATSGAAAHGLVANGEETNLTARGGSIVTTGGTIDDPSGPISARGAQAFGGGRINLFNVGVTTNSAGAHGLRAANGTIVRRSAINATNTAVTTHGDNAPGIAGTNGARLTMTGGSITTTGVDSPAVRLNNNTDVTLTGVSLNSTSATFVSSLDTSGRIQNITVGAGTTVAKNNGTLLKVNRINDAAMDGIVNLTLEAGSVSSGNIVDLDGLQKGGGGVRSQGGKTNFTALPGAIWSGIVRGVNDTAAADGASITIDDASPIAGNVSGGANSVVTFTNGATIGGGVSIETGSTGTFNGETSIGGNVLSTGSTLAFNGTTSINQNVEAQGSVVAFNGAATISQGVSGGSGSSFSFAGPTTIGQSVSGSGTTFQFSQGQATTIGGDVVLSEGSSLKGGTTGTPVTITGNAVVSSGSTLGGNLFVSGALNGTGGTLSPGNSVGTQSYATSAGFAGAYTAEVNSAGASDLVIIRSGNLDLAGIDLAVAQENGNGGYVLNHDYTIVQTVDGNVVNTFKSATLDSSFANTLVRLDPVKYAAKDAKVSLSVDPGKVASKRSGLSPNQDATMDGAISVAGRNTSVDAALQSTDTKGVMDQLSGEVHGSAQAALLNSSSLVQRAVSGRMRANIDAGALPGAPMAQASGTVPAGGMPVSAAYPLWAEVLGSWNSLGDDGNAAKTQTSMGGLFVGGDVGLGKGWRVGGALGFTDGKAEVDDRSSKADVRSYTAAIYGGNSWAAGKGSVNFLAGAAYTRHNIETRRSVTIGGNQTLEADYRANATQLFSELGYAIPMGRASVVEPYLGVAWINQRAKGFSESGGTAALSANSRTDNVTSTTLGVRGKTMLDMGVKQATLTGGLGWRHAGGDVNPSREVAFIQGNGTGFKVAGAPIAKNAAVVDLGAEMVVGKNAAMGLGYSGQFGNGNTDNTGSLYLKVRFK